MICDAHVHTGYFPRKGYDAPFYYSPRRIFGVLKRCGVDEFIFSSTNAVWDFSADSMHREAAEMIRIAGGKAHPFFWVTDEYLKRDRDLSRLPDFYQGFKLHGGETPWLSRPKLLNRVLSVARERRFPIQIHTGANDNGTPNPIRGYLPFCRRYPEIKFDLAHGQPDCEVADAVNQNDNVFVDCAFRTEQLKVWLNDGARRNRLLYGSDMPAPLRHNRVFPTAYLRGDLKKTDLYETLSKNFMLYLNR